MAKLSQVSVHGSYFRRAHCKHSQRKLYQPESTYIVRLHKSNGRHRVRMTVCISESNISSACACIVWGAGTSKCNKTVDKLHRQTESEGGWRRNETWHAPRMCSCVGYIRKYWLRASSFVRLTGTHDAHTLPRTMTIFSRSLASEIFNWRQKLMV